MLNQEKIEKVRGILEDARFGDVEILGTGPGLVYKKDGQVFAQVQLITSIQEDGDGG